VATFITLLLVPVFYSIFVLDLKLVKWEEPIESLADNPPLISDKLQVFHVLLDLAGQTTSRHVSAFQVAL